MCSYDFIKILCQDHMVEGQRLRNSAITLDQPEIDGQELALKILESISEKHCQIGFDKIENVYTLETNLNIYRTRLQTADNFLFYGYSSGIDSNSQIISLAEAAERWLFICHEKQNMQALPRSSFMDKYCLPSWATSAQWSSQIDDLFTYVFELTGDEKIDCIYPYEIIFSKNQIYPSTSSGNAVHLSFERAIESGLLELHERHLLMKNWCNGVAPHRFPEPLATDIHLQGLSLLGKYGFETELYFYSEGQLPPVFIRVIRSKQNFFPCLFVGTGTGYSVQEAILGATKECLRLWTCNYFAILNGELPSSRQVDQGSLYYAPHRAAILRSFFNSESEAKIQVIDPIISGFAALCSHYKPIIASLRGDTEIPAVRVFSPFACPMFFGQRFPEFPWPAVAPELPMLPHPY